MKKKCKIKGCHKSSHSKGVCGMHSLRFKRHGSYEKPKKKIKKKLCCLSGCDKPHYGLGYCNTHWAAYKRTGDPNSAFSGRHGMTNTPAWRSWQAMINRCTNEKSKCYSRYGGRGIKVCERWLDFVNFYNDMGDRPDNTSLDRIDNDGNYEKSNCKWSTPKEQGRNKSNNVNVIQDGRKLCLSEYCDIYGVPRGLARGRLVGQRVVLRSGDMK